MCSSDLSDARSCDERSACWANTNDQHKFDQRNNRTNNEADRIQGRGWTTADKRTASGSALLPDCRRTSAHRRQPSPSAFQDASAWRAAESGSSVYDHGHSSSDGKSVERDSFDNDTSSLDCCCFNVSSTNSSSRLHRKCRCTASPCSSDTEQRSSFDESDRKSVV